MVLGMSLATYTLIHVLISLVGIGTGFVVLFGMLSSKTLKGWTGVFLATTVLTSVTGYGFPFERLLPSHIVGAVSLVLLTLAIFALYGRRMSGTWRWVYVVTALMALYLNVFVGIIQAFLKVPVLKALAPTQKEPPFQVVQLMVLVLFVILIQFAVRRFHPQTTLSAHAAAHQA
jgi:hypothetical protein